MYTLDIPSWAFVFIYSTFFLSFGSCWWGIPRITKAKRQINKTLLRALPLTAYAERVFRPEDVLMVPVINVLFAASFLICFLSWASGRGILLCLSKTMDWAGR